MTGSDARLFCSRPFRDIDVVWFGARRGDVYLCCSSWLPVPVGNVLESSIEEIWNGSRAQELRASILDGSFRHCVAERCPFLSTVSGPVSAATEVSAPELRAAIDQSQQVLPHGPREINCSYDRSCNLSCPSCRDDVIVESRATEDIEAIQQKLEKEALPDAEYLYITGSGDAFGSPFFNRWLRTMPVERLPRLRTLHVHTNALLWTPKMWSQIPEATRARIRSAEISIDAATAPTYALNRRGGDFEQLIENLAFIRQLRREGPLAYLKISMVVQENNFLEMPAFVALGQRYEADSVYFSQLVDWHTFSPEELERRSVGRAEHPRHQALLEVLRDECLDDPRVDLGNLTPLRSRSSPATVSRPPGAP